MCGPWEVSVLWIPDSVTADRGSFDDDGFGSAERSCELWYVGSLATSSIACCKEVDTAEGSCVGVDDHTAKLVC